MQPDTNAQTPPPSNNFYFLNEQPKKTASLPSLSGSNFTKKIILLVIVFIVIVVLIEIVSSLTANKSVNLPSLYNVISVDNNINLIAQNGTQNSTAPNLTDLAYNALGTSTTNNNKLERLLTNNNIKLNPALIITDNSLSARLNKANSLDNYNTTFTNLMSQELSQYQAALSSAYKSNSSPIIRHYLSTDYTNAKLLIIMLQSNYS